MNKLFYTCVNQVQAFLQWKRTIESIRAKRLQFFGDHRSVFTHQYATLSCYRYLIHGNDPGLI